MGWFGQLLDGSKHTKAHLSNAERLLTSLRAGGLEPVEIEGLGRTAIDLSQRLGPNFDVLEMPVDAENLSEITQVRADLLQVSAAKPNSSPSKAYLDAYRG